MQLGPIQHKIERSARQLTLQYLQASNIYCGLEFGILRMEMRWGMIIEKHFNDNSIKHANCWHYSKRPHHSEAMKF